MKKRTKRSIVWLMIMTLFVITLNVMPISASQVETHSLSVGDYVRYGKQDNKDILWYIKEQDENGLLLVQEKFLKHQRHDKDKIDKIKGLLEDDDRSLGMVTGFYINPQEIVFKVGQGTKDSPYTLYKEWKETPVMKANKTKLIISGVALLGNKDVRELEQSIDVEGVVQVIQSISYDGAHNTLTYVLEMPIKQNQSVKFSYTLSDKATTAITKAGENRVLKQLVAVPVLNETVDYVPQQLVITKSLQDERAQVGQQKTLTVAAKGEGALTFKWFKNDILFDTQVKDSFNQEVSSSYTIHAVTPESRGHYRVEVSDTLGGTQTTRGELSVHNQYQLKKSVYPVDAGKMIDNSLLQDGVYKQGDVATVTATPISYYRFVNWTENGKEVSRDQTYSFAVTQDRNLVANFRWDKPEPIPQYRVYITVTPKDAGTVRGDYTYNKGEHVTLKAKAKEGYIFESWTENGEVISRNEEYSFTVKGERRLKANFEEEQKTFKQQWRNFSSREQKTVKDNFKAYLPYTIINETLNLTQLNDLTKGYFTKDQLREVQKNMDLLEDVGIELDWEVIKLKKVSNIYFKDLPSRHWAYDNITKLAKRGIVTGYPDETFKPNQPLTVADTFTFLDRVLLTHDKVEVKGSRSLVERYIKNQKSWAFPHVASISAKLNEKTLKVIGDMENQYVSRELLAQVLYEVTEGNLKKVKPLVSFTDTYYSAYKDGINYCIRTGLLEGTTSYTMEPEKPVTRAEMMTILQRLENALN